MWPGVVGLGVDPLAVVPAEFDDSSPQVFQALLNDPNADYLFILKTRPVLLSSDDVSEFAVMGYPIGSEPLAALRADDIAASAFRYFSDRGYIQPTTTEPIVAPPRLTDPYTFEAEIPIPGGPDSRGSFGFGAVKLANPDGALDVLAAQSSWSGQSIEILLGGTYNVGRADERTLAPSEWGTVFSGIANSLEYDLDEIEVGIRAPGATLDSDLNTSVYAGTGGFEGDDSIKGRSKPVAFGKVRNYAPPEVDETDHVFQLHDGSIEAVDAVRVKGVAFTSDGDTTNLSGWTPVAGKYKTDLSRGLVRIGEEPDGTVTVDFRGDNTGGYIDTAPAIVRRIVTRFGGLKDPEEIDAVSFANIDADQTIGYTTDTSPRSNLTVVDEILASVGGYWYFTRNGQFHVGTHADPLRGDREIVLAITRDMIVEHTLKREYTFEPIAGYRLGYRKYWHVQQADEIDESVSNKSAYSDEFRFVQAYNNQAVKSTFPLADDVEIETLLDDGTEAETLGAAWGARDRRLKHFYSFTMARRLFRLSPGDMVTLDYRDDSGATRFDLTGDAGEVIRIAERGADRQVDVAVLITQTG